MSFNTQTCLEVKNFEHKNVFILATCYWQRRRGVHRYRPPRGFAEPKHVAAKYQHWLLLLKRLSFYRLEFTLRYGLDLLEQRLYCGRESVGL
jgi:hypothetical protein